MKHPTKARKKRAPNLRAILKRDHRALDKLLLRAIHLLRESDSKLH
jgi:hypothetical protein